VAVAAGLATLKLVQAAGFYDRLAATTRALCEGLARTAQECGVTFSAASVGGMFGIYFRGTPPTSLAEVLQCDGEAFNRFFHAMLAAGVYLAPSAYEAGFVSSAHGEAEIGRTISAAKKAFESLRS
jgi:glutamate-1-semialdehyde 2,1-aminomutase